MINYITPAWKGLTNRDESGLYFELIRKSFAHSNVRLEIKFGPLNRALLLVKNGKCDLAGATDKTFGDDVLYAHHPIYRSETMALFERHRLKNWNGMKTILANPRRCAGSQVMGAQIGGTIHEVNSRTQALQMLLRNRVDYYIDDGWTINGILGTTTEVHGIEGEKVDPALLKRLRSNYVAKYARGRQLQALYHKGNAIPISPEFYEPFNEADT
ncbi:MAG: hypothetical protein ACYTGH_14780 [Planctomycetota bacterium]